MKNKKSIFISLCTRVESNHDYQIRNLASYPLNDECFFAAPNTGRGNGIIILKKTKAVNKRPAPAAAQ